MFKQELAWASHLGLSAVVLQPPMWNCANYASVVNSAINNLTHCRYWFNSFLFDIFNLRVEEEGLELRS